MSFKVEKKQVTRYVLELTCSNSDCSIQEEFIIGYDFLTRKQALIRVPSAEWNGWNISDRTNVLCPKCNYKKWRKENNK